MNDTRDVRSFYRDHPEMVSSPFGGVDFYLFDLLESVWRDLGFPGTEPGRLLEIGCGRAWLRDRLTARGWAYIGIDLVVPDPLRDEARGPDGLGDTAFLPFPDGVFDAVVCIDAYEHFPNEAAAVREFSRVLKAGGGVFLSTPNYGNFAGLVKWWMETFGRYERETWAPFGKWTPQAHERGVTIRSVKRNFRSADFKEGKCLGYAEDLYLGLCPWAAHPGFPEAILFRLQRWLPRTKKFLARTIPTLSLHQFWKWTK